MELERLLAELNFDPGAVDGVFDERTRTAIALYQEFAALAVDGEPGPELLAELRQVARAFAEINAAKAIAAPEPEPEPEPEVAAETEPEPEPEAEVAAEPEPEPEPEAEDAAEPEPEPEPEAEVAAQPEPEPVPEPEVAAEPELEPEPESEVAAQPEPEPEPAAEPKPKSSFNLDNMIARLVEDDGHGQGAGLEGDPSGGTSGDRAPDRTSPVAEPRARVQLLAELAELDGYGAFQVAFAAAEVGDFTRAIELYTRAINGGDLALSDLADAFYNRANARSYAEAYDFAIADYGAAIVNKPEFPGAYYNRGFAFKARGQRTRALADFMKARALGLVRLGARSPDQPPPRR